MFTQGTVVLIPFPFTDLTGSKVRPAIIASKGAIGDDLVLVFLTSQKNVRSGTYDVVLVPNSENGLKTKSVARCSKIATLDKKIVVGELGTLTKKELGEVRTNLKKLFAL